MLKMILNNILLRFLLLSCLAFALAADTLLSPKGVNYEGQHVIIICYFFLMFKLYLSACKLLFSGCFNVCEKQNER